MPEPKISLVARVNEYIAGMEAAARKADNPDAR